MDLISTDTGQVVFVHDPDKCAGQHCCIHNPSDHPLNTAPLHWRGDRGIMERICEHGIGHTDPDDIAKSGVHGCDGCCW